jgi:hypothetical protein
MSKYSQRWKARSSYGYNGLSRGHPKKKALFKTFVRLGKFNMKKLDLASRVAERYNDDVRRREMWYELHHEDEADEPSPEELAEQQERSNERLKVYRKEKELEERELLSLARDWKSEDWVYEKTYPAGKDDYSVHKFTLKRPNEQGGEITAKISFSEKSPSAPVFGPPLVTLLLWISRKDGKVLYQKHLNGPPKNTSEMVEKLKALADGVLRRESIK